VGRPPWRAPPLGPRRSPSRGRARPLDRPVAEPDAPGQRRVRTGVASRPGPNGTGVRDRGLRLGPGPSFYASGTLCVVPEVRGWILRASEGRG